MNIFNYWGNFFFKSKSYKLTLNFRIQTLVLSPGPELSSSYTPPGWEEDLENTVSTLTSASRGLSSAQLELRHTALRLKPTVPEDERRKVDRMNDEKLKEKIEENKTSAKGKTYTGQENIQDVSKARRSEEKKNGDEKNAKEEKREDKNANKGKGGERRREEVCSKPALKEVSIHAT